MSESRGSKLLSRHIYQLFRICLSTDGQSGAEDERVAADKSEAGLPIFEMQAKCEPVEEGRGDAAGHPEEELDLHEGCMALWRPTTQTETGRHTSEDLTSGRTAMTCRAVSSLDTRLTVSCSVAGACPQSPLSRGLLGYAQYRNLYNTARRRTAKRLMFKKGFPCPYCEKCFERSGHLERHKRIHTGEKPYRCEICGRRFGQNCSLKEHMKIHRRCK